MSTTARAICRVLVRVFAKAFAYLLVTAGLVSSIIALGEWLPTSAVFLTSVMLVSWATVALFVFRDKVREEAQRLRSNG